MINVKHKQFLLIVSYEPGRDGRCVQSLGTNSPHCYDMRLLTIPSFTTYSSFRERSELRKLLLISSNLRFRFLLQFPL